MKWYMLDITKDQSIIMRLHLSAEMTFQDRNKKTHVRRRYWQNWTKLPHHQDFGILVKYAYQPSWDKSKIHISPFSFGSAIGPCSADRWGWKISKNVLNFLTPSWDKSKTHISPFSVAWALQCWWGGIFHSRCSLYTFCSCAEALIHFVEQKL